MPRRMPPSTRERVPRACSRRPGSWTPQPRQSVPRPVPVELIAGSHSQLPEGTDWKQSCSLRHLGEAGRTRRSQSGFEAAYGRRQNVQVMLMQTAAIASTLAASSRAARSFAPDAGPRRLNDRLRRLGRAWVSIKRSQGVTYSGMAPGSPFIRVSGPADTNWLSQPRL